MKAVAIIALCIGSAMIYGIVHDEITAHLCVEYFTIGHPPVFNTESPALLGLGWGVIATWWVGLILGVPLAIAARLGRWPRRTAASLIKPLARLLLVMACCALLSGTMGYVLASTGRCVLIGPLASQVPADKRAQFIADLWAHLASYGVGFIGGVVLIVLTLRQRRGATKIEITKGSQG